MVEPAHIRSVWTNLGLAWASVDRPEARVRIARALLRWDVLAPPNRAALRDLVDHLIQPTDECAASLLAVQLVSRDDAGRCTPLYPGAGLVGLDAVRRALGAAEAAELLTWYRRGFFRVRKTYDAFEAERPRGALATFASLARHSLAEGRDGRNYRSTVRGWAVARLVEDAAALAFVDEDGPTRPRLATPEVGA